MQILEGLNEKQREIVEAEGNILAIANPGTGKTALLEKKYAWLVLEKGYKPEEVLCLTFTNKAKRELEDRILKLLKHEAESFDVSRINVHTFHSYVLDQLDADDIVSSNLLRYSVYDFMKNNEVLNYSDSYLLDQIVPKMENLIRYLKSYGITPEKIDSEEIKKYLEEDKKVSREELEKFAGIFVDIFRHYEEMKGDGLDYSDVLLKFFDFNQVSVFSYVLVDELQDVNKIEADIVLKTCDNFVAVGDKKQAIFGFQGGSILNFKMFEDSKQFVLGQNYRSSQPILDYSKNYFLEKTEEGVYKKELEEMENHESKLEEKPKVCDVDKGSKISGAVELGSRLSSEGKTAIIARTNTQVTEISEELKNKAVEHSATFVSASKDTKKNIISFLKGLLGNDIRDIKNSMFTPYFPIDVQSAFEISADKEISLEDIYAKSPEFEKLRKAVRSMDDVKGIFKEHIIPLSISYGREYMVAAVNVRDSFIEACDSLEEINLKNVLDFVSSSDMVASESNVEKKLVVTTVHKAKGKEFDNVVYLPKRPQDKSNFQDRVVEGILASNGRNVNEELEEEALRIDFVAFTRAMNKLYVLAEKAEDYLVEGSEKENFEFEDVGSSNVFEKGKEAYNLFLQGQTEKAKELLKEDNSWIKEFVKEHFEALDRLSYSSLKTDAFDYLENNLLDLKVSSPALQTGTDVHEIAEKISQGEEFSEVSEHLRPYKENIEKVLEKLKVSYPEVVGAEEKFEIPCSEIVGSESDIVFKGKIDLVLKNSDGEYIIVDWKIDKKTDKASEHRRQLEAYKNAYAIKENVPLDKIKVAIGFVGLKPTVNTGEVSYELDDKQPTKNVFGTFSKHVNKILSWKENPENFWEDLKNNVKKEHKGNSLLNRVLEQYESED
ncbi:MAG: UvrD-helicase domain-containing protein [Candidatus Pacearchaeota archaeon]